jgi:hypothetical protein
MNVCFAHRFLAAALIAWLAVFGRAAAQDQTAGTADQASPTAEQLAHWVQSLDADEFLVRETATLELFRAGTPAVEALKPTLAGASLEATNRALFVVRQLALAADVDSRDEAGQLLAELATHKETPALAARAAVALEELADQRSTQAMTELEALGAKVGRGQAVLGFMVNEFLVSLEIGDAFRGTEHDLKRLKWLSGVPVVVFNGPKVTDGWMKQALAVPDLEQLHLYRTAVTAGGLAALAGHATIKQVGIYYTRIDDAALEPLARMHLLNFIKLYGTQTTAAGVKKFTEQSGVPVDFRRGAFLGVGCIDENGSCRIRTVHPGSPAQKAGLRSEDMVVRFGGSKVTNFESLQTLIAARDVGDEVEMDVVRERGDDGGPFQPITTHVKLAPWDVDTAVQNPRR